MPWLDHTAVKFRLPRCQAEMAEGICRAGPAELDRRQLCCLSRIAFNDCRKVRKEAACCA